MGPLRPGAVCEGRLGHEIKGLWVIDDGDIQAGEEGFIEGVVDGILGVRRDFYSVSQSQPGAWSLYV